MVEGLNGGEVSTYRLSVKISLLCRLSVKISNLHWLLVNPANFFVAIR